MLLGMLFASYNGDVNLFRKSLTLHCILANVSHSFELTDCRLFVDDYGFCLPTRPISLTPIYHGQPGSIAKNLEGLILCRSVS
jgi:hypothetical protein